MLQCMRQSILCMACLAEAETVCGCADAAAAHLRQRCVRSCTPLHQEFVIQVTEHRPVFDMDCDRQMLPAGVPMDNGTVAEKAFALAIAGSGLVAFALTVALIQQVSTDWRSTQIPALLLRFCYTGAPQQSRFTLSSVSQGRAYEMDSVNLLSQNSFPSQLCLLGAGCPSAGGVQHQSWRHRAGDRTCAPQIACSRHHHGVC